MNYDVYLIFNSNYSAEYNYRKVLNKYFEESGCYYIHKRKEIVFPIKRNLFSRILIKLKIKKYKYDKVRIHFISKSSPQANIGIYNKYFILEDQDVLDIVRIIAKEYEKGEKM